MPQRDELYLADIVEATRKITTRLADVSAERWAEDDVLRDSVAYQLQIIGEAASSMSEQTREAIAGVPWRQVRGLRNIIVHRYFSIDWKTVLDTGRTDVAHVGDRVFAFLREQHPEIADRFDDTKGGQKEDRFPTYDVGRVVTDDVRSLDDD